ncbi:F0F1 ATP synthase subunit delta [Marinimicrobium sp. ABcell2]|uniref:F0F1 ATP synthase subunit delta n=1 Tax=Marinimicrobium sp. ABcell2 TaxID=3069751 RepID=UPI0027B43290|nr:F0F1 ATP synthase subunit delta [Marinimicrobium sp. ABcell2]MDQ2077025.1 F0F1 ATP synthase subunit delta [Marinimicrobium sp. ABcell2]
MAELSTLARPYARAAFSYARDAKKLDDWGRQLAVLASVYQHEKVRSLIASPSLTASAQAKVVTDVCGKEVSKPVGNFVELLAENKRLPLLPEISRLFDQLKLGHEKAVDVELTTAMALDESTEKKLAKALTEKLARKVNIHTVVDQSLMAGAIIKAGDLVIDGSMRGRLEKLAKAINS